MKHARKRAQESGLAQSGNAFQQNMAAREQAGQDAFDHVMLADDDLSDLFTNAFQLRCSKFESGIRLHQIILPHLAMGSCPVARGV